MSGFIIGLALGELVSLIIVVGISKGKALEMLGVTAIMWCLAWGLVFLGVGCTYASPVARLAARPWWRSSWPPPTTAHSAWRSGHRSEVWEPRQVGGVFPFWAQLVFKKYLTFQAFFDIIMQKSFRLAPRRANAYYPSTRNRRPAVYYPLLRSAGRGGRTHRRLPEREGRTGAREHPTADPGARGHHNLCDALGRGAPGRSVLRCYSSNFALPKRPPGCFGRAFRFSRPQC
jgi:hypothetical protein